MGKRTIGWLVRMVAQQFYSDDGRLEGLEDEVEVLANAGDVVYYHPYLVHGASRNRSSQPRKVLFTPYYPVLEEAEAAQRQRDLSWLTEAALEGRCHDEHLAARTGDTPFHRVVGQEGWAADMA